MLGVVCGKGEVNEIVTDFVVLVSVVVAPPALVLVTEVCVAVDELDFVCESFCCSPVFEGVVLEDSAKGSDFDIESILHFSI